MAVSTVPVTSFHPVVKVVIFILGVNVSNLVVFACHHIDVKIRYFKSLYHIISVAPLFCLHPFLIALLSETLTRFYFDADVIA
jgi:hypothetical protein